MTTATDATTLQTFSLIDNALEANTRHLCANVLPINDESIGPDWQSIRGSVTGGGGMGSTTLTDAGIAGDYVDDQFVQGRLTIISGTGAGQSRTVTNSTASTGTFTVAAWTISLDETSRYEVINKTLVATLRTNTTWVLRMDFSDLAKGTISAQDQNFQADMIVRMDSTAGPGDYPYHRLRVGREARILLLGDWTRSLVLDCPNKRAWVADAAGDEVFDATAYVVPEEVLDANTAVLAEEWLPMPPGFNTLYVQTFGVASWQVTADVAEGFLG